MERIKKSQLFLVPKHQVADKVEKFPPPISLSNSIYLIIAKLLANMLCQMINELVGPFQSTFILVDNAIMAGEIAAAWGVKDTKGFIREVNFAKVYDSLDWDFLWSSIRQKGFLAEYISWVWRYITSHVFLVVLNR